MLSRHDAVLASLDAGVVVHSATTEILEANERARALLGISDLEGRLATDPQWQFLEVDGEPMPLERFPVMQVLDSGEPLLDLAMIIRPPVGRDVWLSVNAWPLIDDAGTLREVAVTFIDVSERTQIAANLRDLATHDPLTGLPNRVELMDETARAISAARRSHRVTAVLLMDLDRFKGLNDAMGHDAGDALMTAAAARLRSLMRAEDLVARIGGDEFAVVMRDLDDADEAVDAAHRIVAAFHEPFAVGDREIFSTASVGITIASAHSDAKDLVREAETAMYAAKNAGRDRASIFDETLRRTVAVRLAVENDLRRALARQELEVWYQPEIDLMSGSVIAAEALLRWKHPSGEVWTASQFIDVAEDTGLILDIGDWVLQQACAQGAEWAQADPGRRLQVRANLSALQLAEEGLLPAVDQALADSGLDPTLLCLEITETSLLQRADKAASNLDGVHERGISIAIDDFGTGYASLTYLDAFPIDVIKIDRSFVTDAVRPHHRPRLIAGVIALARELGVSVVAEGVEQGSQAAFLRDVGCPSAQGWLYSKAVPADEFTSLLEQTWAST